ncbi:MAG: hypothetical protein LBM59_07710 [Ruminococcus sp.]|jgi:bacteriocin-like protein|nr:hypothetical protein [Ruminococcus sp.]
MKKEDLIKKARERGITLTDEQAEKYINLSEEELENIVGGGGLVDDICTEPYMDIICEICGEKMIKVPYYGACDSLGRPISTVVHCDQMMTVIKTYRA